MNIEWVKVCGSNAVGEIWLHEVLKDNNIPYKNEEMNCILQSKKMPKIYNGIHIYVPKQFEQQVLEYIREYNSQDNI